MDKMNRALERAKMLVGFDVDEEASNVEGDATETSFFDDFNREYCTLSTQQVLSVCFVFFLLGIPRSDWNFYFISSTVSPIRIQIQIDWVPSHMNI